LKYFKKCILEFVIEILFESILYNTGLGLHFTSKHRWINNPGVPFVIRHNE